MTPDIPVGEVASRCGPLSAGSGVFEAIIRGKGGHAALPQLSIDPVMAATNVIISLQNLVSREADPLDPQVYLVNTYFSLVSFTFILILSSFQCYYQEGFYNILSL